MFVISTKGSIFALKISDCRKASVCFLFSTTVLPPYPQSVKHN